MAWLLIDNSNSRTKLALANTTGFTGWRGVIPTADLTLDSLQKTTAALDFSGVVLASVVPAKAKMIAECFEAKTDFHALTYRSPLGYGFDLDHPEQIGNDRLANILALREKYGCPGIAIDFGTAVTFSVLSAEGKFSGGAIAPGMDLMTLYLANRTAQLPQIVPTEPTSAIGKNTVDAMLSGAIHGHRGMVKEILRRLTEETGLATIVATGGGAEFAVRGLPEIDIFDPDLTLEGLRSLAMRVFL